MRLICNDVAGTTVASSLMDKQGRKSLLLISFAGMVLFYIECRLYIVVAHELEFIRDRSRMNPTKK